MDIAPTPCAPGAKTRLSVISTTLKGEQLADNRELGGVCDHIRLRTPQKRFIGSLSHKRRPAAHGIWQELNASPERLDL